MKPTDVFCAVFPIAGNSRDNKKLRDKLNNSNKKDKDLLVDTPLSMADNPDAITERILEEQYEKALLVKDKLEDKAKATIVCVTISISLILGASNLLNTISSRFSIRSIQWICYILFLYAVLLMIIAGIMDIKVLVAENTVYTVPLDTPAENKRSVYDLYTGKNWAQNLIRNNYVYSAYECIRNALISLFIIMLIAMIPINCLSKTNDFCSNANDLRDYTYAEDTITEIEKYGIDKIKSIVETALPSMQTTEGQIYSIADSANSLFIRFQIRGNEINILSIDEISWEQ